MMMSMASSTAVAGARVVDARARTRAARPQRNVMVRASWCVSRARAVTADRGRDAGLAFG